jgi:uncharacterized protein YbcI
MMSFLRQSPSQPHHPSGTVAAELSPEAEESILMSFPNHEAPHTGTRGGGMTRNDLSTALVRLYRELFGRGPVTTTTCAFDGGYVTFLRDVLTPHERLLVRGGRTDLVCQARAATREAERERLVGEVQRVTGRPVLHDSFQFQPERNLAIELFWTPTGSEEGPREAPAYAIAPPAYPERKMMSR